VIQTGLLIIFATYIVLKERTLFFGRFFKESASV
jgi:hypothetical protein